jgi:hypothetical protein
MRRRSTTEVCGQFDLAKVPAGAQDADHGRGGVDQQVGQVDLTLGGIEVEGEGFGTQAELGGDARLVASDVQAMPPAREVDRDQSVEHQPVAVP